MLQTFVPYRTAVELAPPGNMVVGMNTCDAGVNGIPSPVITRYVSGMSVKRRHHAIGQSSSGLSVIMTPASTMLTALPAGRVINIQSDSALQQACEDVFRFDANQTR